MFRVLNPLRATIRCQPHGVLYLKATIRLGATATMSTDTSKYKLNHTMLRIKDPKRSQKFYETIGMKLVNKIDMEEGKFTLYFFGSPKECDGKHWTDCQGLVELTHNWGSEDDPKFSVTSGNEEPNRGFGHICISVDNIQAACSRLEKADYTFQKKLTDGRMRHIAFVKDPDGYWVEIIGQKKLEETENVDTTETSTYISNHSMVRIKDREKSVRFYEDVLGMKMIRESNNPDNEFDLVFFAYGPEPSGGQAFRSGILEITYNYGTEKKDDFQYHNGNTDPKGFGHLCISVDDLDAACERFEKMGVKFQKRLTDGKMKDIAFILDPDQYWWEVIQNENIKKRAVTALAHDQGTRGGGGGNSRPNL